MSTEKKLIAETEKWAKKIAESLSRTSPCGIGGNDFVNNIKAYVSDSGHFMKKRDYVRSFEAIIWAWAWLEIGKEIDYLEEEPARDYQAPDEGEAEPSTKKAIRKRKRR